MAISLIEDRTLYKGNSWEPGIAITENSVAKDCTNLECKLVIKATNDFAEPVVLEIPIEWVSQAGGTGKFTLVPAKSETLAEDTTYFYEIILYDAESTLEYAKTIKKGKLKVLSSLGVE